MGDIAEWHIEQGMDELDAHRRGECDGPCQYCEQGEAKERRQKRPTDE